MRTARAIKVPHERIVLTGDDAWELTPAPSALADQILEREGITGPFVAAQLRFGQSVGWDAEDAPRFAASLGRLADELALPVVFVPCMIGRGSDDRSAAELVRAHLQVPSANLTEELDAGAAKAILGRATVGVGTANHFCVFAASMATPVVGLYATPYMEQKLVGLGELWPDRVTALTKNDGLSPETLTAAARRLVDARVVRSTGGSSAVPVHSDAPVQFLSRLLETVRADQARERPYSARFVGTGSVETYEREFAPGEFMANVSMLERDAVRSALTACRHKPFVKHLDFACGTGRGTGYVQGFAESTVGVDISDSMLARAGSSFPAARFLRVDVVADPVVLERLGPFDLATIWRFMAPAEPELRRAALSAIARAMSDGGLLLVNNNANRSSLHGLALVVRSLVRGLPLESTESGGSLSHLQLSALLRESGFRVVATKAIAYLPEQLTRRLPGWSWMPVERMLGRLNLAPRYAVNQLLLACPAQAGQAGGSPTACQEA